MNLVNPRTVLVTGAAGGIGRATVHLFAESGWHVIGVDHHLSASPPQDGFFIQSDISIADNLELNHSEHEMLRYLYRLQARDLSLVHSMIPLGSCTMKLNATSEMLPVTWPEFARLHPFAPVDQTRGYQTLFRQLEGWLAEIAGFSAFSLQPNAGSQGEYSGLMVIRAFHRSKGEGHRDVCLIPVSAHGTNPASAAMVGMTVVVVACDRNGNVDVADLETKAAQYRDRLAALMLTKA